MDLISKNRVLSITQYALLVILLASFFTQPVVAQGPTPTDDEVNKIAEQLYCPVCESTPLDVCPTEACRQWRDVIRAMLADGKSEDEIKQHFVEQYGVRVLNEPPNRLVSYLVPVVAFLLGSFILLRGFQAWKKPIASEAVSSEGEAKPVQDGYIAKMEEELKKIK